MKKKNFPDYAPADKYLIINNNDSVLRPVVISLPEPPPLKLIDGYGVKNPVENKFERKETPKKLQLIEKRAREKTEEWNNTNKNNRANGYHVQKYFWEIVENEKETLQNEIQWMWHMWWYMRYGYWFMCFDPYQGKSKPVWLPPWYFRFLNLYYIEEAGGWPEYRDRDRRIETYKWYLHTATETFKEIDDEGRALTLEMIDLKRKVFFGDQEPKRRRGGATARENNRGLYILERTWAGRGEIIADLGEHASKIFREKLAPAWYHQPLWSKAVWDGVERPAKSIKLIHPKTVMKELCLGAEFGYTESSSEKANDSRKLVYADHDEEGKNIEGGDVVSRWAINKETMAQNLIIHGYSGHPSTVDEMKNGGAEYHNMFDLSDFYVRKPSGQTLSGLARIFTPAPDGMDGFVDPWGYSVIDTPTDLQIKYAPKGNTYATEGIGAKESLQNELNTYLADGSHSKLKEYRNLLRKKPMDSSDCWKGSAGDIGFNIIIVDKAIADSKHKRILQGNFEWLRRDEEVIFRETKKGRWFVSDLFLDRANKWKWAMSQHEDPATGKRIRSRTPFNPLITSGGIDAFRSRTASQFKSKEYGENTSLSDGGISVVLNYDSSIDGDRAEEEWETMHSICNYRYRPPTLDEFCEDALKTFFYYGCMCNGERNTEYVIDYFIKRGYANYLLYMMDAKGRVAPQPWVHPGGVSNPAKGDMINFIADHIEKHGHKEWDITLLNEMKTISSPDQLHSKDLLAAFGWALYGYKKGYQKKYDRINTNDVIQLQRTSLDPHRKRIFRW